MFKLYSSFSYQPAIAALGIQELNLEEQTKNYKSNETKNNYETFLLQRVSVHIHET